MNYSSENALLYISSSVNIHLVVFLFIALNLLQRKIVRREKRLSERQILPTTYSRRRSIGAGYSLAPTLETVYLTFQALQNIKFSFLVCSENTWHHYIHHYKNIHHIQLFHECWLFPLTNLKNSSNSLHLYLSSYIYSFVSDKAKCALLFSSFP